MCSIISIIVQKTSEQGLKEEYFGSFEGQDGRLNPEPPYKDFFVQYGGENQQDVQKRIKNVYIKQFLLLWQKQKLTTKLSLFLMLDHVLTF